MKVYDVVNVQSEEYKLVISTSYVSPLSKIFLIAKELSSQEYKGEVIFDLLLSNGFASNRFLKMTFDGTKLTPDSTKVISNVSDSLLKEIYNYYFKHPEYVERSSLPDTQKHLLKNKLIM